MAIKLHSSFAVHPGAWLRTEIVEPHSLTVGAAAEHLGVTRQTLSKLLNGNQDLTADMAIRFEKVFGISADMMIRMQAAHDIAQARLHEDEIEVRQLAAA